MLTLLKSQFVKLPRSLSPMRVLLLHPEDDPESGPWIRKQWERVVDLGVAGEQTYARWGDMFHSPVEQIPKFEIRDFSGVREALAAGLGRVVDEHGLDWWELISIRFHEQIALILRLEKLVAQLHSNDELFVTRPGLYSQILSLLSGRNVQCFRERGSHFGRTRRVFEAARKFSFEQLLQILGDKYDAGYQIRRLTARQQARFDSSVVLMPVAQANAARTAIAYAAMVPDRQFLLVTTRQSGCICAPPENVVSAGLASYATANSSVRACDHLLARWQRVETSLGLNREISALKQLGVFASVTKMLRDGLAIRDAWLRVFEREPVSAVFCNDDTNPYTHMPLLLAQQRRLPTIACHHGALDGGQLVKRSHADIVLAKGRMEEDYLVNTCRLPEEKVVVGAPSLPPKRKTDRLSEKSSIVFFSEPYALDGGRCREFYRELLPPLADLALGMNRELVVKLHPMESVWERRKFVNAALSCRPRENVRIVEGLLSEELLDRASFAITVQSTAAVDCTIRGIPVFVCAWLDYSCYGYLEQFIRFRAGMPLRSPAEIASIPSLLANFSAPDPDDLLQTISSEKLAQLLTEPSKMAMAV
jgi:hypothetical protein